MSCIAVVANAGADVITMITAVVIGVVSSMPGMADGDGAYCVTVS